MILLVPKETSKDGRGHCFIATGRGSEGFITDADAGDICREATPAFAAKDYSTGLELVTLRTAQRFANEFHFSLDTTLAPPPVVQSPDNYPASSGGGIPPFAFFIIFIVVLFIPEQRAASRARRGAVAAAACRSSSPPEWIRGGGGRGGWSGGGGGFGDLEAAWWLRRIRWWGRIRWRRWWLQLVIKVGRTEKTKQARSRLRYIGLGV